jgi:hypothetical protein
VDVNWVQLSLMTRFENIVELLGSEKAGNLLTS